MVGECNNDLRCFDYPVSRSVCSCVLDEPVIYIPTAARKHSLQASGWRSNVVGYLLGILSYFTLFLLRCLYVPALPHGVYILFNKYRYTILGVLSEGTSGGRKSKKNHRWA